MCVYKLVQQHSIFMHTYYCNIAATIQHFEYEFSQIFSAMLATDEGIKLWESNLMQIPEYEQWCNQLKSNDTCKIVSDPLCISKKHPNSPNITMRMTREIIFCYEFFDFCRSEFVIKLWEQMTPEKQVQRLKIFSVTYKKYMDVRYERMKLKKKQDKETTQRESDQI